MENLDIIGDSNYLQFTSAFNLKNAGHIYTDKGYKRDTSNILKFATSTNSPPVVYEFYIDSTQNMNVRRIYANEENDLGRFIGLDKIVFNNMYLLHLLWDSIDLVQVLRVYNRQETNFGIYLTQIIFNEFRSPVSGFKFLSYLNDRRLFIRTQEQWKLMQIQDRYLVIDTFSYRDQFNKLLINETTSEPCKSSTVK